MCSPYLVTEVGVAHCGITTVDVLLEMEGKGVLQNTIPNVGQLELTYVPIKVLSYANSPWYMLLHFLRMLLRVPMVLAIYPLEIFKKQLELTLANLVTRMWSMPLLSPCDELSITDGVILITDMVVIPFKLCLKMLEVLHGNHQEIDKTRQQSRLSSLLATTSQGYIYIYIWHDMSMWQMLGKSTQ